MFWVLVVIAAACLIGSISGVGLTGYAYRDASPTMENTIQVGDRLLVSKGAGIRRGDVVVLRVPKAVASDNDTFVKRVIGLPGDHVACCDSNGQVTVNGKALNETYLFPGSEPSTVRFSVTLKPGQIWVLGDNRIESVDSRRWGPVPQAGVVGPVLVLIHGGSFTSLQTPQTYVADGLSPADTRTPVFVILLAISGAAIGVLLTLLVIGIVRTVIRSRRRPAQPYQSPQA